VLTVIRSPDTAKMDPRACPRAADMALAVWNGYSMRRTLESVTPRRASSP
jgi:hypothetical protein